MGTQVLPAQDFLIHQIPADIVFNRRRKPYITAVNGTAYPKQRQITNNNGHRKSNAWRHLQNRTTAAPAPATMNRSASTSELTAKSQKKKQRQVPVMTTTLNRVKSMNCIENISGTGGRLRNSPAVDYDDWYAGSTFVLSPSPASLPLPSFFNKKQGSVDIIDNNFDDIATKDLRHLLRLA